MPVYDTSLFDGPSNLFKVAQLFSSQPRQLLQKAGFFHVTIKKGQGRTSGFLFAIGVIDQKQFHIQ
ncbi:uncharacterized protein METZ01_LOCUS20200 [marine metagenome]|uniref:Uncharacterized protein n=1 Tax=marine metagenome TaxID=408172 RepID=A0A381PK06_9ZZZZ